MNDYLVEYTGNVREVYSVTADSLEDAQERAMDEGILVNSEASSMEFYSVREDD